MKHLQIAFLVFASVMFSARATAEGPGPSRLPVVLSRSPAKYPKALMKTGQQGKAVVEFIVTTNGDVVQPHVINDCDPLFAQAAIACVLKWKFTPGIRDGHLVNTRMSVPIEFQLPNENPQNEAAHLTTTAGPPTAGQEARQP
jgi:TonB family protein